MKLIIRSRFYLVVFVLVAGVAKAQCTIEGPLDIFLGAQQFYQWELTTVNEPNATTCVSSSFSTWTLQWLTFGEVEMNTPDILQITFIGAGTFIITHTQGGTRTVNVHPGVPPAPPTPRIVSDECGYVVLGYEIGSSPPVNTKWYWQTTENGESQGEGGTTLTVASSSTWYLQSRSEPSGEWGGTSGGRSVTIKPIPGTPTPGDPIARCGPGAITLSANPGTNANSIRWYTASSGGTPLSSEIISNLTATTTYYAASFSTSTNCLSPGRLPVTATIIPPPPPGDMTRLNPSTQLCEGDTIKVRVDNNRGTALFDVTIDGINIESWTAGTNNELHLAIPYAHTGEVKVKTRSEDPAGGGCGVGEISEQEVVYFAWTRPGQPTAYQDPMPLCPGNSVLLSATPLDGNRVHWYTSDVGGSPIISIPNSDNVTVGPLSSSATYYVASYRGGVCEGNRFPYVVTVMPNPPNDGVLTASSSAICEDHGVLISYDAISGNGANGVPHYFYSTNGGVNWTELTQHTGATSFTHTPQSAGVYRYLVRNKTNCGYCYDPGNTCTENNFVDVTVEAPLTHGGSLSVNGGYDDACVGNNVIIDVDEPNGDTYIWITLNGESYLDESQITPPDTIPIQFPGSYQVTMRGRNLCGLSELERTFSFDAWVKPGIPTNMTPGNLCEGQTVGLKGTLGVDATGVKWYTSVDGGEAINMYPFTAPWQVGPLTADAEYWASSYAMGNCESDRVHVTIDVFPLPVDSEIEAPSYTVCLGNPVVLETSGGVGDKYFSAFGPEGTIFRRELHNGETFQHTPPTPGSHTYRVENKTGCGFCGDLGVQCFYDKSITVSVIAPPKVADIAGEITVISGKPYEYSLTGLIGATSYNWDVGSGTIISGQNTGLLTASFQDGETVVSLLVSNPTCGEVVGPSVTVTAGLNYLIEEIPIEKTSDINGVANMTEDQKYKTVTYFDGMGRVMQSVEYRKSPGRKDIIQPRTYDQYGREEFRYLPYVGTTNDGSYRHDAIDGNNSSTTKQAKFYWENSPLIAQDPKPYAQTVFESSPLSRVIEQGAPGAAWQPDSNHRTIRNQYLFNSEEEVLKFTYDAASKKVALDSQVPYYQERELLLNKTTDEEGHEVLEFTDKEGKTVCKKVQVGNGLFASTYYVYDVANLLVAVLQPEAVNTIQQSLGN